MQGRPEIFSSRSCKGGGFGGAAGAERATSRGGFGGAAEAFRTFAAPTCKR